MHPITIFVITLLSGPGVFWLFCNTLYRRVKTRKYPEYLVDGVGDTLFLPLFNAVAFYMGFDWFFSGLAFVITLVIAVPWGVYRAGHERRRDWSTPKRWHFNIGGWYHILWFSAQCLIIISVLLESYNNIWIWLPLIAYLFTSFYTYAF